MSFVRLRRPLPWAVLLGVAAGMLSLAGANPSPAISSATVGQQPPVADVRPVPKGRHMETVSDVLSEATTIPPGTELLVGPGRIACQRDNLCILHDEDDPRSGLVFGIDALRNGQHDYLVGNTALAANPVAVRLVRTARGSAAYQALQVIDARTRETIGLQ